LRSPVYALCLSILAVAAACGTADVPPTHSTTTGAGGTSATAGAGGSSATTGASGSAATGGSAGAVVTGTGGSGGGAAGTDVGAGGAGGAGGMAVLEPASPLPLVVDTFYARSGFMGDGATPGAIVLAADCPMRAPGGIGMCSKFTYNPIAAGPLGWGGVYWQSPANNWGTMPGKHIEAGATKVTFYAAGAKGGEVVTFLVGGIGMGADPYQDPPSVKLANQVLTTTMTAYSIDLTGFTYVSVIGGFGWTIEAPAVDAGAFDPTPITFYVDGIQWVK